MGRNAQDIIDDMRNIVKPRIAKMLLEANFEGCGKEDKAEFETEFEIILTLAEKALEQEPCEDAISRQAVLAIAGDSCLDLDSYEDTKEFCDDIKALPPVLPKRKQGEWIFEEVGVRTQVLKCSKCGTIIKRGENFTQEEFRKYINDILREKCITLDNFCHNCGAEMKNGRRGDVLWIIEQYRGEEDGNI